MLKSLIEELRRVVGGDREVVHGLVGVAADSARPDRARSGASGCNPPLRCC